jgi:hypothetical protein
MESKMYQGQQQQQKRRRPGSGRVWPARDPSGKKPQFTGSITLPDGHEMRVALWEEFKNGQFNGFSVKLSEDTRQQNGYQAQGQQGQPQGYGQQRQGYPAPGNYTANGYNPPAPPQNYGPQDQGYVPGFDD